MTVFKMINDVLFGYWYCKGEAISIAYILPSGFIFIVTHFVYIFST